jgi:hypothetical protein
LIDRFWGDVQIGIHDEYNLALCQVDADVPRPADPGIEFVKAELVDTRMLLQRIEDLSAVKDADHLSGHLRKVGKQRPYIERAVGGKVQDWNHETALQIPIAHRCISPSAHERIGQKSILPIQIQHFSCNTHASTIAFTIPHSTGHPSLIPGQAVKLLTNRATMLMLSGKPRQRQHAENTMGHRPDSRLCSTL